LTQNFLTLFNQHKARHIETRQKLEALTKLKDDGAGNKEAVLSSNKKLKRESLPDDEDQHDYATWDPEMVDRLAAGPEGRKKMAKRNNIGKVKSEEDDEFRLLGDVSYKNPITGVMMVTDHKQLFSDDEDDDVPSAKKRKE
jgi:hypothetical protein